MSLKDVSRTQRLDENAKYGLWKMAKVVRVGDRIRNAPLSFDIKPVHLTMKSFYKKVKSMRELDQPYCPITTIKDAQGQIITDKHQIKQRWGGYFEGLLNPNEDTRDNNFSAQDILEHEPETLRSEVEESLKSAKTGKAPGIDGISIDIIKAAGEAV